MKGYRNRRQALRVSTLVVASILIAAGCSSSSDGDGDLKELVPSAIAEAGSISVVTSPDLPPAVFLPNESDDLADLTGYEVEIVEAAAGRLGLDVKWSKLPFDQILGAVAAGDYDVASGGITETEERLAKVTMISIATTATQWAGPEGSALSSDGGCGATVSTQKGTVFVDDLESRSSACESAGLKPIKIKTFETNLEVVQSVLDGDADALVADEVAVQWIQTLTGDQHQAKSTFNADALRPLGEPYDEADAGLAVAKDATELADALQAAVQSLIDDGSYMSALDGWNSDSVAIEKSEVAG